MSRGAPRPLLAATSIAATWAPFDAGAPLVLLAPWCRRFGAPDPAASWTLVADPWAEPEARRAGEALRRRLEDRVLAVLGPALSAFHGERWSEREARLLLGPWLFSYVAAQIDRWERLALAIHTHLGLTAWGFDPARAETPADTLEAVEWLKGDRYNLQLMTPMMAALGIEVRPLAPHPPPEAAPPPVPAPSTARFVADFFAHAGRALHDRNAVVLRAAHFGRKFVFDMAVRTHWAIIPLPDPAPVVRPAADPAVRVQIGTLDLGDSAFERHLGKAIPRDLPACFLEGWTRLRWAARRLGPFPAAVLSANAWHYDEPFKHWAARAIRAGTTLLGVQHGGNYGIDACSPSEEHETAVTDVFYTWGWSGATARARTEPMPPPKLLGQSPWKSDPARRGILFVTTSMPRFPLQLDWGPERFERYLDRQRRFLLALPETLLADLRVRPHRESLGWGIAERLAAVRPAITIETWEVPFGMSLAQARLFVCDHLSTTFAEALATNRPTLLFWDPGDTPIRPAARGVFDDLRAAGVLFDDPESAARAVDAAYEDVLAWWAEPARVRAVATFRTRFACYEERGFRRWVDELMKFARQGPGR